MIGKYVVVRTYSAGVHIGVLQTQNGKEVTLKDARRIWSWNGAFTLHAVATKGIKSGNLSCVVKEIGLTEAIEVIPTTTKAEKILREYPEKEV